MKFITQYSSEFNSNKKRTRRGEFMRLFLLDTVLFRKLSRMAHFHMPNDSRLNLSEDTSPVIDNRSTAVLIPMSECENRPPHIPINSHQTQFKVVDSDLSAAQHTTDAVHTHPSTMDITTETICVHPVATRHMNFHELPVDVDSETAYAQQAVRQSQVRTIHVHQMATNPEVNTIYVRPVAKENRSETILVRPSHTNVETRTIYVRPVVNKIQSEIIHVQPAPTQHETKTVYMSAYGTQSATETVHESFQAKQLQTETVHESFQAKQLQTEKIDISTPTKKVDEETVYVAQGTTKRATETVYTVQPQGADDISSSAAAAASDASGFKSGDAAMGADSAQSASMNDNFNMKYE
jgi:hypothetical protein